jgi:hypothetical protein
MALLSWPSIAPGLIVATAKWLDFKFLTADRAKLLATTNAIVVRGKPSFRLCHIGWVALEGNSK